jgi:hypothetical protein
MSIMSDNGFGGIGLDGSPEMKMAALLSGAGAMEQQKRARAPSEASNWRSRASQNGIRVSQSTDSQFADDEGRFRFSLWLFATGSNVPFFISPVLQIANRTAYPQPSHLFVLPSMVSILFTLKLSL